MHGEALLSLNNEILRDELHIKSYGKRFELLKAIQKLAKHSSRSSCSLSSLASGSGSAQGCSRTYHRGMAQGQGESELASDNWENLDVNASNTDIMNEAQMSRAVDAVVSEVTGTEISFATREKHSFYRKLSNLGTGSSNSLSASSKSGGLVFDAHIPDWSTRPVQQVVEHSWSEERKVWSSAPIWLKMAALCA